LYGLIVLLLGVSQMSKDIPDLLRMKSTDSTDYDPSPSQVCAIVDTFRVSDILRVGLVLN